MLKIRSQEKKYHQRSHLICFVSKKYTNIQFQFQFIGRPKYEYISVWQNITNITRLYTKFEFSYIHLVRLIS